MPFKKGYDPARNMKGRPKQAKTLEDVIDRGGTIAALSEYFCSCVNDGDLVAIQMIVDFYKHKKHESE